MDTWSTAQQELPRILALLATVADTIKTDGVGTDEHSWYVFKWDIDNLIDKYATQLKAVEAQQENNVPSTPLHLW
jgi:hypothetical protein